MNVHPCFLPALSHSRGTSSNKRRVSALFLVASSMTASGCGKRFTALVQGVDASVSTPADSPTSETPAPSDALQTRDQPSSPVNSENKGESSTDLNHDSVAPSHDTSYTGLTSELTSPDAGFTSTETSPDASLTGSIDPSTSWSPSTTDANSTSTEVDAKCTAFSRPREVQGLGFSNNLWGPAISADGQYLYFGHTAGNEDLFVAARADDDAANFLPAEPLMALNTLGSEGTPFITADGLSLYFYATRDEGPGDRDLWLATRATETDAFDNPSLVAGANGESYDHLPWLSSDELTLVYTSRRDDGVGKSDIWMASRASKAEPFTNHTLLPGINTDAREDAVAFSPDGLTVFFTTDRETDGDLDIWQATRSSLEQPFDNAVALTDLNSDADDTNLALTSDGRHLYFSSGRSGEQRLWVASRECTDS